MRLVPSTRQSWALAIGCSAALLLAAAPDRPAEEILKELGSVKISMPTPKGKATASGPIYKTSREVESRKAELIRELYAFHPQHPSVPKLLPQRWNALLTLNKDDVVTREIEETATKLKNDQLRVEGAYVIASRAVATRLRSDAAGALGAVESFADAAPGDARAVTLLGKLATAADTSIKGKALERLKKDFPDSAEAKSALAKVKSTDGSTRGKAVEGEPFELEFHDAIKGSSVSVKDLKGKVVVVDFWATWCGPCVAEMPKMKELYAKYQPQGVEFLGISLDESEKEGGLKKLRDYVAKNEIKWPQYYQGNGWESKFSASLGIDSIPCVYILDAEGKLHSTQARGKLETLIPELLAKAGKGDDKGGDAPANAGGPTDGSTSGKAVEGEPFELEFHDAITGNSTSVKDLKGKVVVVDFWATWCGPCVAEMPKMKDLYAKYQPQGVEFLGISLDQPEQQGGLKKLRDYVAKNEIKWPQYYQGNGWKSGFSSSLGINAIPCVYILDAEGKLHSTKARGKLETLIPELLAKAGKGEAADGGK